VKITDFGIACATRGAPLTSTGMLLGTPAYLAPERVAGGPATPASDLYSLGVVGYECLAGVPPFRGPALQVAEAHVRHPLPALPVDVPAGVAAIVVALTAKDPGDRPSSAHEVAERAGGLRAAGMVARPGAISPVTGAGGTPAAAPLTLTDISVPVTQASLPALDERHGASATWKMAGAGLAVAAALTAVGLGGWQAGLTSAARPHSTAVPGPSRPRPVPMVLVRSTRLTGQPAGIVLADLRRLDLRPHLAWAATLARPPGTVLSVRPGGPVPPETLVTVTVATQPAIQGDAGDGGDGGGDGGGGGGGNDGGGGGGGNSD
jgi:serine/threonine-protein kinase